ncbi:MAG TPA: septum formation initiator family protein [Pseudoclavibacter sp.]|nr:septum formation initiator family protein [Pseudoclavibacter sp.]
MVAHGGDPAPSSHSRRRFGQRFSGFALVLIGVTIAGVLALAPGLRTLVEQRAQIAALEAQVASQQAEVDSLQEQKDRWEDPAYIKAQTRQRLFFVVPGEKTFVIVDDLGSDADSDSSDDTEPTTAITSTEYDWRQLLLTSWYEAATNTSEWSDSGDAASDGSGDSGEDAGDGSTDTQSSPAASESSAQ